MCCKRLWCWIPISNNTTTTTLWLRRLWRRLMLLLVLMLRLLMLRLCRRKLRVAWLGVQLMSVMRLMGRLLAFFG